MRVTTNLSVSSTAIFVGLAVDRAGLPVVLAMDRAGLMMAGRKTIAASCVDIAMVVAKSPVRSAVAQVSLTKGYAT